MRDQLVHGSGQVARYSRTKNRVRRGESKRLRLAGGVSAKSFISQGIKPAHLHIRLELAVPDLRVKSRIPPAKCGEFIGGKLLNLFFDGFYFAHTSPYLNGILAPHREPVQRWIKLVLLRTCALSQNELNESESQGVSRENVLYGGRRRRCKSGTGDGQTVLFARATRGLRRPSLDARS